MRQFISVVDEAQLSGCELIFYNIRMHGCCYHIEVHIPEPLTLTYVRTYGTGPCTKAHNFTLIQYL